MTHLLVRHKVREFSLWKPVFESHRRAHQAATLKLGLVLRSQEDPNDVFVLFDVGDVRKAQRFLNSAKFKAVMKQAGVVGKPKTYLLKNERAVRT
jgi:hypothetical protein